MHVRVLIEFHDIVRAQLWQEHFGDGGHRTLVEVMPYIFLFDVWIHSWKWRGHGRSLDCFSILHEELRTDT